MPTPPDLLLENEALRAEIETLKRKLATSERWMRRQIQESIKIVSQEQIQKATRYKFANDLEREQLTLLERSIEQYFWSSLFGAPQKTVERLIDAEIQWWQLQKFPQMDGSALVLSYQKILDSTIDELVTVPFRTFVRDRRILMRASGDHPIDRDIEHLLYRSYTLSLGRLASLLTEIRSGVIFSTPLLRLFSDFLAQEIPTVRSCLISDDFFLPFSTMIESEVFSRKRHEGKVSYTEAKQTRALMVGNYQVKSAILSRLFTLGGEK